MTLNYENEQEKEIPFDLEKTASLIMKEALKQEGCPFEAEVNLTVVDDEEIHRMNREFRGMDTATDVLSFPMIDYGAPADFSAIEKDSPDAFDPENGELMLGDIVISAPHAFAQAEAYGHSVKREFSFLFAHSMFHLLGYDHMTAEEAAIMEQKQEAVLEKLGITRDSALPDGGIRTDIH